MKEFYNEADICLYIMRTENFQGLLLGNVFRILRIPRSRLQLVGPLTVKKFFFKRYFLVCHWVTKRVFILLFIPSFQPLTVSYVSPSVKWSFDCDSTGGLLKYYFEKQADEFPVTIFHCCALVTRSTINEVLFKISLNQIEWKLRCLTVVTSGYQKSPFLFQLLVTDTHFNFIEKKIVVRSAFTYYACLSLRIFRIFLRI